MMETWCRQLLQMIVAVVFFYAFEYALAIRFHGWHNVNASSLLISKEYLLAMTCALIEYVAELILIPELKEQWWLSKLGLSLVVIGELIRKSAVITAGNAFTHSIRTYYEEDHDLVTGGIYRYEDGNDYLNKAPYAKMAHPWPDHFYPLHVAMGAAGEEAKAELMNRSWTGLD